MMSFILGASGAIIEKIRKRNQLEAYCVKCRAKQEIQNPVEVTLKNGMPATQGPCPVCGTKMSRINKKNS